MLEYFQGCADGYWRRIRSTPPLDPGCAEHAHRLLDDFATRDAAFLVLDAVRLLVGAIPRGALSESFARVVAVSTERRWADAVSSRIRAAAAGARGGATTGDGTGTIEGAPRWRTFLAASFLAECAATDLPQRFEAPAERARLKRLLLFLLAARRALRGDDGDHLALADVYKEATDTTDTHRGFQPSGDHRRMRLYLERVVEGRDGFSGTRVLLDIFLEDLGLVEPSPPDPDPDRDRTHRPGGEVGRAPVVASAGRASRPGARGVGLRDMIDDPLIGPRALGMTAAHELCDLWEAGADHAELRRELARLRAPHGDPVSRRAFDDGLRAALVELATAAPHDVSVQVVAELVRGRSSAAARRARRAGATIAVLVAAAATLLLLIRPGDPLLARVESHPAARRALERSSWPTDPFEVKGGTPSAEPRYATRVLSAARSEVRYLVGDVEVRPDVATSSCATSAAALGRALARLRAVAVLGGDTSAADAMLPARPDRDVAAACSDDAEAVGAALREWPTTAADAERSAQRVLEALIHP